MKQKLKDVIADGRWNWFGAGEDEEDSQDNCYKGLFWDLETRKFLRWNEHKQECKSTESSDR
jgi:hypothetical protein|tara:strand:+ start:7526 stop:7711 length:186 start_codon:yes stop_codon:yes gene_type:complete